MPQQRRTLWLTLGFALLGYLGAANFYSYLIGLDTASQTLCPVCPNIDSSGDPLVKFFARTVIIGTLNAFLYVLVGTILLRLARAMGLYKN